MKQRWIGLLALLLAGCGNGDWGVDRHGRPVAESALEGQWLVINYWAEWCGPCRREVPALNALDERRIDVTVLGVNYDGLEGEALNQAADALGIRFLVLAQDPTERLGLSRSAVLPTTVLVDPEGQVRAQLAGEQTEQSLEEELAAAQGRTNQ